jgi:deazaflavin-dependent oxidoreductase (nitroreductase family)
MSILENVPWIQEHINLYKTDPAKAEYWQPPGGGSPRRTLLLTTKGRKSGEPRDVPLIYGKAGDRFVVVASLGGAPDHPSWYKNLRAAPDAEIQVGVDHYHVKARDAEGAEREELWAVMAEIFPTYDEYARLTQGVRKIPVVVLDPQ